MDPTSFVNKRIC